MGTTASRTPPAGPSLAGTLALVFVAVVALFAIDTFLAGVENRESQHEASRLLQQGQRLAQQGRSAEAIDRFRSALSVSRGNREAQLGLADALLAVGRLSNAETLLTEMLQRNPTDGATNLAMARLLAKQGHAVEATSYYHQAIYGQWKQDTVRRRVQVRFELIDLLVRHGDNREVLAELLPLQDEAPDDLQTRKHIASLYLAAGSPLRARDLYRQIVREDPQDYEAYAGLGEAEFARGNYLTARANLTVAARLKPEDETINKRLGVCIAVLSLDPTRRGISISERFKRSVELAELALKAADECFAGTPPKVADGLVHDATLALRRRVSSSRQEAAIETNLELAEQLWKARTDACGEKPAESEEPLAMVLAKLAQ